MTDDIKKLNEWVEGSRNLFEQTKIMHLENIYSMGFNTTLIKKLPELSTEDILNMSLYDVQNLFAEVGIEKTDIESIYSKSFDKDKTYLVYVKEKLNEAKKELEEIETSKKELEDIERQVRELKQSFIDYVRSPEFKEKKLENVRRLREQAENESDPVQKRKYLEQLQVIENIERSNFLLERFEKVGSKEVESVLNSFFDNRKGEYMMEKFKNSCKKFGFKSDIYQYFFNIEENLLDEEYHVFNNLFLFVCMRFISYADINVKSDKMYVEKTINNLAHLIYHDFQNIEEENDFLQLIRDIDDKFRDYEDMFREKNTTHPNHPVRIEQTRIYKENKKSDLIKNLIEDYPDKFNKDELESKSYDELVELQEKELTSLINDVIEEDGKRTKARKNATSMEHPITKNKIVVKPKATSYDSASSVARGLTTPFLYFDEPESQSE